MTRSRWSETREIGAYANRKILGLQARFLAGDATGNSARASLAQLRALGTPGRGAWALIGSELFLDLPDFDMSEKNERRMIQAVSGALQLYARHQQGRTRPMAMIPDQGEQAVRRRRSFGWSCRRIEFDLGESQGIRRRMQGMEAASDFDGVMHHARSLIDLMRGAEILVDYGQFARDLYLIQYPDIRDEVFMTWSRDYYTPRGESPSNPPEPLSEKE